MICFHLSHLMNKRKIRINDMMQATDLSHNSLTLLCKETIQNKSLDLNVMGKLCQIFNCTLSNMLKTTGQHKKKVGI